MRKRIALLIALCMTVLVLSACGSDVPAGTGAQDVGTTAPAQNSSGTEPAQESTNDDQLQNTQITDPYDGTVLKVDTSRKGVVAQGAEAVNSKQVVINGVVYGFPFLAGQLFDNGWSLAPNANADQEFGAGMSTQLLGCNLFYEERDYLHIQTIQNASDTPKTLKDCLVTACRIEIGYRLNMEKTFSFVLPGGITWDSTASDVLAAYGPTQNNSYFDMVRVSENGLQYLNHKTPGMQYSFSFNEDGSLYSVSVEVTQQ